MPSQLFRHMLCIIIAANLLGACNTPYCFRGSTLGNDVFPCHCANGEQCDDVTGSCPSGCSEGWTGPGCQIGALEHNLAFVSSGDGLLIIKHEDNGNEVLTKLQNVAYSVVTVEIRSVFQKLQVKYHKNEGPSSLDPEGQTVSIFTTNERGLYNITATEFCQVSLQEAEQSWEAMCSGTDLGYSIVVVHPNENIGFQLARIEVEGYQYYECAYKIRDHYWYGPGCLLPCNCEEQCRVVTGRCPGLCRGNYLKNFGVCLVCSIGFWGEACSKTCHCKLENEPCNMRSGYCDNGCRGDWRGTACDI